MYFFSKLWHCLTCWELPVASPAEIATAQVIVTQAVEFDRNGSPGPGNAILAEIAFRYAKQECLQVIPQKELLAAARPTLVRMRIETIISAVRA